MDQNFFDEFTLAVAQKSGGIFAELYSKLLNYSPHDPNGYDWMDLRFGAIIANRSDTSFFPLVNFPGKFGVPEWMTFDDSTGGTLAILGAKDAFKDYRGMSKYSNQDDFIANSGEVEAAIKKVWYPNSPWRVEHPNDPQFYGGETSKLFLFYNPELKMAIIFQILQGCRSNSGNSNYDTPKAIDSRITLGIGEINSDVNLMGVDDEKATSFAYDLSEGNMNDEAKKNAYLNGALKNFKFSPIMASPFPASPADPISFTAGPVNGLTFSGTAANGTDTSGILPYYRLEVSGTYTKD